MLLIKTNKVYDCNGKIIIICQVNKVIIKIRRKQVSKEGKVKKIFNVYVDLGLLSPLSHLTSASTTLGAFQHSTKASKTSIFELGSSVM